MINPKKGKRIRRSAFEVKIDMLKVIHYFGDIKITRIITLSNCPYNKSKTFLNDLYRKGLIDTLDKKYFLTDLGKKYLYDLTKILTVMNYESYFKVE